MAGITLEQAQTQLTIWLDADAAVASGQKYEINGRMLMRSNAAEITAKVEYWNNKVITLSQSAQGRSRARTMVVR